jgi:hypothetical protein
VVAEQVIGTDPPVEFVLREEVPGGELRPENPKTGHLQAGFGRPACQTSLRIEVSREALDLDRVNGFQHGFWGVEAVMGHLLRSKTLEVPMTDGPCEHVQQLDMSGQAITAAELISKRTGQCGDIAR